MNRLIGSVHTYRTKQVRTHHATLITNGHFFPEEIQEAVLLGGINDVLFSVGAASFSFYKKVRGDRFDRVMDSIPQFHQESQGECKGTANYSSDSQVT